MTEAEAKDKWCPFARCAAHTSDAPANRWSGSGASEPWRDDDGDPTPLCIASACLAWRDQHQWRWDDRPDAWVDGFGPKNNNTRTRVVGGFCGLAGEPR